MGLKEITHVRQYTTFTRAGKMVKMYEVTFTTEKTEGEFTMDIPKDEYDPDVVKKQATVKAEAIDSAIS